MNYGSFYGGRKGTSFVIVKSYPDIISMTQDFMKGGDFAEVKYDEYVLINTFNKNHPDNGKLFRRGFDYNSNRTISAYRAYRDVELTDEIIDGTEEEYQHAYYDFDENISAGGAQYIGTIVGPAGRAPHLSMMPYSELEDRQAQQGYDTRNSSGSFSLATEDLIPGKYVENNTIKYNDEIKWYSVSVRNLNNDESDAYIGLKIPYPVIDFITEKVSSYNEDGEAVDTTKAERVDSGQYHPFYEKWKLSIPGGIKGDAIKKLRIIRFQDLPDTKIFINEQNYYYYSSEQGRFFYGTEGQDTQDIAVETVSDKFTFTIGGLTYTIQPNTQIMIYDLYSYEQSLDPQDPQKIYFVGILNQIVQDSFEIFDNGDIHIDFTDGTVLDKKGFIKKIDNVEIAKDSSQNKTKMKIYFNTQDEITGEKEVISYDLKLIDDITISNDGTIRIDYTDNTFLQKNNYLKAIERVDFRDNQMIITLNTGEEIAHNMAWISDFSITNDGQVLVKRNGNTTWDSIPLRTDIKWITDITYDRDSNSTIISYNNDSNPTVFENVFRSISNAYIDADSNQFVVEYNTKDSSGAAERDVFELAGSLISGVTYENGVFSIHYTGKSDDTFSINYPAEVIFNNSDPENDDFKLKINALDGTELFTSLKPIDSVYDMQITSDHHLVALFASRDTRNEITNLNKNYPGYLTSPRDGKSYDGWLDLGSVFTDSGILIGLNLNHTDFGYEDTEAGKTAFSELTPQDIINRLSVMYPSGVSGNDLLTGKIVTVGLPGVKKDFYAFDYSYQGSAQDYKGWYFLGNIETAARGQTDCFMGNENEMSIQLDNVSEEGLFFIVEE